jgi:hypothetical protein
MSSAPLVAVRAIALQKRLLDKWRHGVLTAIQRNSLVVLVDPIRVP